MTEIKIIKDYEEEIYYATQKRKWDDDDELSIIAYGTTEVEALQNAVNSLAKTLDSCERALIEISEKISGKENLDDKFYLDHCYIKKPCNFGDGNIAESFDALAWNEEAKVWSRFYR